MAHRGRPHPVIAAGLAVGARIGRRRLNAFLDAGLEALRPRKAPGRAPKVSDHIGPEVRRWVIDGPAAQGLMPSPDLRYHRAGEDRNLPRGWRRSMGGQP